MGRTSEAKEKLLQVALELMWSHSYGTVSVDQICEKAGVKKGSFYYFFPSKSDLAVEAYEAYWQALQPVYDQIFSPQFQPLQRLECYCRRIYENQKDLQKQKGQVLGCPIASAGSELSTQDEKIRQKSSEIFERMCRYFESVLRDACSEGLVSNQEPATTARCMYSFLLGMLLQAKIKNDAEVLRNLYPSILQLAGARISLAE